MGILEFNNTITKLTAPAANDMEVSFGLAALKLLEDGDQAAVKKLMKIRDKVKAASEELDALMDQATG